MHFIPKLNHIILLSTVPSYPPAEDLAGSQSCHILCVLEEIDQSPNKYIIPKVLTEMLI